MMGLGARARGTQENQATKSERKDEEISICIIIYLAFETLEGALLPATPFRLLFSRFVFKI